MAREKVDTSAFNAMCQQASQLSAVPYEPFVRNEVGRIMEKAIDNTRAADPARPQRDFDEAVFTAQPASLYQPRFVPKGGRHVFTSKKGNVLVKYFLWNRYPDALWSGIERRRIESVQRKKRARGLAKQSWLRIAQQLEVPIKAPAYVERAIPVSGIEHPENTAVAVEKSPTRVFITIENAQPTVQSPQVGGSRALQLAINGRVKFFQENFQRLVFSDLRKIAAKYPGLKIDTSAAAVQAFNFGGH